jgi:hypothetical protein
MNKIFLSLILSFFVFQAGAHAKVTPLTEVDVIRYAVFCPKFRAGLKKENLTGVVNNFCVLKTEKLDGRAHKIMKQNRYGDVKKYKEQVARITEILALQEFSKRKINPTAKEIYKSYLPEGVSSNYQVYLEKNYSTEEVGLVKKHSEALKELAR